MKDVFGQAQPSIEHQQERNKLLKTMLKLKSEHNTNTLLRNDVATYKNVQTKQRKTSTVNTPDASSENTTRRLNSRSRTYARVAMIDKQGDHP